MDSNVIGPHKLRIKPVHSC